MMKIVMKNLVLITRITPMIMTIDINIYKKMIKILKDKQKQLKQKI